MTSVRGTDEASGGLPGAGLRLYVTGRSARSRVAIEHARRLAEQYLGTSEVETVDVLQNPEKAEEDAVVATPMLVRRSEGHERRVVGDLAAIDEVASWLQLGSDAG